MNTKKRIRLNGEQIAIRNAALLEAVNEVGVIAAAHRFKLSLGYVYKVRDAARKYEAAYYGGEPPKVFIKANPEPAKPTVSIFDEAAALIYGAREEDYGDPLENLGNIARYWETYLHSRGLLNPDINVGGLAYFDVCRMMELVKIARLGNSPFARDSSVDVCGYEGLIDRIRNEE